MSVLFYLAFRTLVRSRISFVLLLAAVTAGVGFQVPNTANIDGYTEELHQKGIARDTGHVLVTARSGGHFEHADDAVAKVKGLSFVRGVATRLVHVGSVFIGDRMGSAPVVGIDPAEEQSTTNFCGQIKRGRCLEAGDDRVALIGYKLAERLDAGPGKTVKIALPFLVGDEIRMVSAELRIVGALEGTGGFRTDYDLFVPIGTLRSILNLGGAASEMRIFTADDSRAGEWAKSVAETLPDQRVEPWYDAHEFVRNAIEGNRALSAISTTMVVVAVMIPVLALLYIHVLAERRRIATIAALGFSRREIFLIHFFEALLVGGLGTLLGCGVGWALCRYFQGHPIFEHAGFVVRPNLTLKAFMRPALVIFSTTIIAGILPALLASRAEPASELRRE